MHKKSYESLHVISQAAQQMGEQIEQLKTEGLIAPELADIRRLTVEQLRAEISLTAVLNLAGRETEDASRIEKERLGLEKKLNEESQKKES